jgi:hypothetical protein
MRPLYVQMLRPTGATGTGNAGRGGEKREASRREGQRGAYKRPWLGAGLAACPGLNGRQTYPCVRQSASWLKEW